MNIFFLYSIIIIQIVVGQTKFENLITNHLNKFIYFLLIGNIFIIQKISLTP